MPAGLQESDLPEPGTCCAYLLRSCDNGPRKSYVGWTNHMERRLNAHNSGKGAKATRGRQWEIAHLETFDNKSEAMSREYFLKKDRSLRRRLLSS